MATVDRFQTPVTPAAQYRGPTINRSVTSRAQSALPASSVVPSVTGQSPPPSSSIVPTTPIAFTVTGIAGAYVIAASYASGFVELVWNGTALTSQFNGHSTASVVSNGTQSFYLSRAGGWPGSPTFQGLSLGGPF